MPRKITKTETSEVSETVTAVDKPKVEKPKAADKPKLADKPKVEKPKAADKPKVEKPKAVDKPSGEESEEDDVKKQTTAPTKESVLEEFDSIISLVDEEILKLREGPNKAKGVKFLRTLGKRAKFLRKNFARVLKQKNRTNRKNNTNSGFLKPVKISSEMSKFTGWSSTDLKSRVDVTKFICNYIKENNLQNPEDRRQIVADAKLSKLLKYDSAKDDKPLTYYRIQSYIKPHFSEKS